jgi:hypothetical protein
MPNKSKKQKEDLSKIEKASTIGTGKKQRYTPTSKPVLTALVNAVGDLESIIEKIEHPEDKKFVILHAQAIKNRVALRFANEAKKEELAAIRAKPVSSYLPKKLESATESDETNPEGADPDNPTD